VAVIAAGLCQWGVDDVNVFDHAVHHTNANWLSDALRLLFVLASVVSLALIFICSETNLDYVSACSLALDVPYSSLVQVLHSPAILKSPGLTT
jgi:hypothetical protein